MWIFNVQHGNRSVSLTAGGKLLYTDTGRKSVEPRLMLSMSATVEHGNACLSKRNTKYIQLDRSDK